MMIFLLIFLPKVYAKLTVEAYWTENPLPPVECEAPLWLAFHLTCLLSPYSLLDYCEEPLLLDEL